MWGRTAAITAAAVVSTGAIASAAVAAAGPPPPPTGANGAKVKLFATGVKTPTSFAFGGGTVFEGDGGSESNNAPPDGGVFVLKGGKATMVKSSFGFVGGLTWRNGTLYISGASLTKKGIAWQLQAWSGWDGAKFAKQKVIWTAPKKLDGLNGVAFGPDGRLYVGVDVGLLHHGDHGPPKTPYVYKILSFKANGSDLQVFASGIRQPWQFAFAKGSSSPYVSDLGQDSGAKNPPDFVLKVKKGDNYGFPKCNWIDKSKCKGFTKPWKFFPPHTDIMGLGIIGKTLYMTSFAGHGASGQGGEVYAMPVKGGAYKPVATGFVAPTVGLGVNKGTLYVGELSGQVFSITP
jgi:hypothetical protein